ncbi:unnamed protein product [Lactuca saligna]|uniref:RIN4 pathogenic type III effector avirulence factor Avr cleavage site domain-containing protein n=1 Tax=Lactuca saligna TaxID=75948 RepID=A0AA35Y8M1_LACSI|nr:unnamed protein product [Lactuca saligna]
MAQVPKFGNWENEEDVPYTAYFEKAKKARKTKAQFPDPSSNNELPFQAPEEADIKHGDSTKSEPERRNTSRTEEESRVSQEEVNMKKSSDSLPNPRRTSRQSGGGSDRSFDNSPMHSHTPARSGNKGNTGSSPMSERKVSSEVIHGPPSSTPGRSKLKQVPRGDETDDDGPAIPKFGGWDEKDPASAEAYTHIFNKAREDRHNGGGKSPMVSTDNVDFYGQNQRSENSKGCGCFPWSKK